MIINLIVYCILFMKSVYYQKNQKICAYAYRKIYITISLLYLNLSHVNVIRTNEFALMSYVKT